jgi:hypothetical protein
MRLKFSFVGGAAMLASLLAVPEAKADAIVLPNPEYYESKRWGTPIQTAISTSSRATVWAAFRPPAPRGWERPFAR